MIGPTDFDARAPATPAVALTAQCFSREGWLCAELGLEHRPEQEAMALATARAFTRDDPLLFEAGTGVGKSLAYLIPGLIQAIDARRPLVVSSHTIALQEQIHRKDLALCRNLFEKVEALRPYAEFKAAVLIGRGNYLCGHRLSRAVSGQGELFGQDDLAELERIAEWSVSANEGVIDELQPRPRPDVWEWVNADSTACNNRHCSPETCHYRKARARVQQAQVIIVNHSLLFALINAGAGPEPNTKGILFPNDMLVLDEAHRVPDIATDHFGGTVSSYGIERALTMLYNPRKNRGLLTKSIRRGDQEAVLKALAATESFFNGIRARYLSGRRSQVRLHAPEWTEPVIIPPLQAVEQILASRVQQAQDETEQREWQDQRRRIMGYIQAISASLTLAEENHVYWLERGGRQGKTVILRDAPLDVAPALRDALFERDTGVLLTSATLSSGRGMAPFQKRVGAEMAEATAVASPFDYERNMQIYIAADAPDPSSIEGRLDLDFLEDSIRFCLERVEGGTLVLFTSYADMRQIAAQIEPWCQARGRGFLMQGGEYSRTDLVRYFKADGQGVLFGTDSFWTGVDIPGSALSQVIITRLPFENPGHPVSEARAEWIKTRGGNPFAEMTLPDAVVKFRQGVGRLIRGKTDSGVISLLDSRLLRKPYGREFLAALPKRDYTVFTQADREEQFDYFRMG